MSSRERAFLILSLAIPAVVSIFDLKFRDFVFVIFEFCAQLATIFILLSFLKVDWKKNERSARKFELNLMLLIAVSFSLVADALYNLRAVGFLVFGREDFLYLFDQICFTGFAGFVLFIIIRTLGTFLLKERLWLIVAFPIFFLGLFVSYKFILSSYYETTYSLGLKINTSLYALILCLLGAVLVPFSLRVMQRKSYWFFQIVFLFVIADFAIRYQTIVVNSSSFSWAEFGWTCTFVGLFWLCWLGRDDKSFIEEKIILSPYISVRSIGTIAVSGANSLFLLGILLFNLYSFRQAADLTSVLFLMYVFWLIANEASYRLSNDLQLILPKMFQSTKHTSKEGLISYHLNKVEIKNPISEINQVLDSYNGLVDQANKVIELSSQVSRNSAIVDITAQVSHDIRSPLAALNMVTEMIGELPEEKRLLIRNATNRINDIANQLLRKGRQESAEVKQELGSKFKREVLITSFLEMIISEKRCEYRDRLGIEIIGDLNGGYGLFVNVDSSELSRVISNIINNSVEAFNSSGKITISAARDGAMVKVSVVDNGKGIPKAIMARIGEKGVSFGKDCGVGTTRGLGLSHAFSTVQQVGGTVEIFSESGFGTEVVISLPKVNSPSWFLEAIELTSDALVVSLDDDQTIHQIWSDRFKKMKRNISHLKFSSIEKFRSWVSENKDKKALYLIDYEYIGQNQNGLDIVDTMSISDSATLVTSRYEDLNILNRAKILGVKIVPKSSAPFIPILLNESKDFHSVLIDDDELTRMSWIMAARSKNKSIVCLKNYDEFLTWSPQLGKDIPIFIDVSLENERGEDVAQKIFDLGFHNLRLATGHSSKTVLRPSCVLDVVGKSPPF